VVVFRDVTPEVELDRLKSDFVSMVSHEICSPLASITAAAEALTRRLEDPVSGDGCMDLASLIRAQTLRLGNFVEDVLQVSRLDMGTLELKVEPVPVLPVLKHAITIAQAITSRHTITLKAEPGLPLAVADAGMLGIVLGNLLRNAVNYAPGGGPVTVEAHSSGHDITISVQDEGMGIPEGQLDRIFDRFSRLDNADSRKTYGHGLGLYIARGIVERHGGRIWVQSEAGWGTCFSFTIPAFLDGADSAEPQPEETWPQDFS
jgi:signal transduction histidine kinase